MGYVHAVPWYCTCMESEDNLLNSVLDIELKLGCRHLYLLSHLADLTTCF